MWPITKAPLDLSKTSSGKPTGIAFFAKRELERLLNDDPWRVRDVLNAYLDYIRDDSNLYVNKGHERDAHGKHSREMFGNNTSNTQFLFDAIGGILSIHVTPPGPILFGDGRILIIADRMPATHSAAINDSAIGTKLSKYIAIPDVDIDVAAPGGIEKIKRIKGDDYYNIILEYTVEPYPYDPHIETLRVAALEAIARREGKLFDQYIKKNKRAKS